MVNMRWTVHSYKGLYSNGNEQTLATCNNIDESHEHNTEQKTTDKG